MVESVRYHGVVDNVAVKCCVDDPIQSYQRVPVNQRPWRAHQSVLPN